MTPCVVVTMVINPPVLRTVTSNLVHYMNDALRIICEEILMFWCPLNKFLILFFCVHPLFGKKVLGLS